MEYKICKRCQKELPVTEFYFRKEQGRYRDASDTLQPKG